MKVQLGIKKVKISLSLIELRKIIQSHVKEKLSENQMVNIAESVEDQIVNLNSQGVQIEIPV